MFKTMTDLIEDEPRQQPKPVPFFQNSLVQPTVPEVSLLLQDSVDTQLKRNDSFSGTEFQTYNSWRWKHMNSNKCDATKINKHTSEQNCYLIKDKYYTSDIEKRKNEILYGDLEEPRRPLPPRTTPIIPNSIQSFFSNTSFDDLKSEDNISEKQQKTPNQFNSTGKNLELNYPGEICFQNSCDKLKLASDISEKQQKKSNQINCTVKNLGINYPNQIYFQKDLDNAQKLYNIISEQNKQLHVLQDQIQQLLKLQDVKDKQIEQLLKSQESKEKKIKQLLQSLDSKEQDIELLTNSKEKQEQNIQELLKTQEIVQQENFNLLKKLNELKQKEMQTVGVMACIPLVDAETCTSFDSVLRLCSSQKAENTDEDISVVRESSRFDEKSLSLHSSDLPVIQESIPSPQSSIHVDIQDFPDSSDDSESEAVIPSNICTESKESHSNHLGYTFYNNVLTQLKDIIHNSGEKEKENENGSKKLENHEKVIKQALPEGNFVKEHNRLMPSFHECVSNTQEKNERFTGKHQNICFKDPSSPSDISLKINALALKYLKKEQISEFNLQTSIPPPCQSDVTIYNVTNLSFGSLRYLDRYQMLPEVKENQRCIINVQKGGSSSSEFLRRKKKLTIEESITSNIENILDMSTLNQQPKLL